MFFKKQKRIEELEKEVSDLKENLREANSNADFRDHVSRKAIADILNLLSIRGITSDLDYFNMVVPYKVRAIKQISDFDFQTEPDRYLIEIPTIRLNVPEEVYNKYLKAKVKG